MFINLVTGLIQIRSHQHCDISLRFRTYGINITEYPVFVYQIRFLLLFYMTTTYNMQSANSLSPPEKPNFIQGRSDEQPAASTLLVSCNNTSTERIENLPKTAVKLGDVS